MLPPEELLSGIWIWREPSVFAVTLLSPIVRIAPASLLIRIEYDMIGGAGKGGGENCGRAGL
jgi:hypothetical protein